MDPPAIVPDFGSLFRGFPLFACLACALIITLLGIEQFVVERSRAAAAARTPVALDRLLSTVKDAESGQRGYLLVGEDVYLAPFHDAETRLPSDYAALEDGLASRQDEAALHSLIEAKMAELSQTIALRSAGDAAGALAIVRSDRGRIAMDQIRQSVGNLSRAAGEAAELSNRAARRWLVLALAGLGGILVLAGNGIAVLVRAHRALARRERRVALAGRMEALGHLSAGIAHDFNNILHTVRWAGEALLARSRNGGADVKRELAILSAAADRGEAIIGRLLSFARSTRPEPAPFDAEALLAGLSSALQPMLGERITLRLDVAERLPMALADRAELETVLINLAQNACDAMPQGGTLTIAAYLLPLPGAAPVTRRGAARSYICLAVRDDGEGMTPEILANAMEPFFTTKPAGCGTGLGLALARSFAESSGGDLLIESKPGRGTAVSLFLPTAPREHAGESQRGDAPSSPDHARQEALPV